MTHENERVLSVKELSRIGGRAIHPVNVRLGGFYRAPARAGLAELAGPLRRALDQALDTVRWVAGFDFPDHACDADLLALSRPGTYPPGNGPATSSHGLGLEEPLTAISQHL